MQWWRWMTGVLVATVPLLQAPAALAMEPVVLPFDQGESARVVQGYNGGTHHDASVYGLDIVLSSGETSGAAVLAPISGSIAWAFDPGDKTGCFEVVSNDRQFGVMLCHVLLDRPLARGEKIARGEVLGTVGAPG